MSQVSVYTDIRLRTDSLQQDASQGVAVIESLKQRVEALKMELKPQFQVNAAALKMQVTAAVSAAQSSIRPITIPVATAKPYPVPGTFGGPTGAPPTQNVPPPYSPVRPGTLPVSERGVYGLAEGKGGSSPKNDQIPVESTSVYALKALQETERGRVGQLVDAMRSRVAALVTERDAVNGSTGALRDFVSSLTNVGEASQKSLKAVKKGMEILLVAQAAVAGLNAIGGFAKGFQAQNYEQSQQAMNETRDAVKSYPVVGGLIDSAGNGIGRAIGATGNAIFRKNHRFESEVGASERIITEAALQEKANEKIARKIELLKAANEVSRQIVKSVEAEVAARGKTGEEKAVLSATQQLADFEKKASETRRDTGKGDSQDTIEARAALQQKIKLAEQDAAAAAKATAAKNASDLKALDSTATQAELSAQGRSREAQRAALIEQQRQKQQEITAELEAANNEGQSPEKIAAIEARQKATVSSDRRQVDAFDLQSQREQRNSVEDSQFNVSQNNLRRQNRNNEADLNEVGRKFDTQIRDTEDPAVKAQLQAEKVSAIEAKRAEQAKATATSIADYQTQASESALRAQMDDYGADTLAFEAGWKAKIKTIEDADEKAAAIAARDAARVERKAQHDREVTAAVLAYETSEREATLRAAMDDYAADQLAFDAAWDAKLKTIQKATEREAALLNRAAQQRQRDADRQRGTDNIEAQARELRLRNQGKSSSAALAQLVRENKQSIQEAGSDPARIRAAYDLAREKLIEFQKQLKQVTVVQGTSSDFYKQFQTDVLQNTANGDAGKEVRDKKTAKNATDTELMNLYSAQVRALENAQKAAEAKASGPPDPAAADATRKLGTAADKIGAAGDKISGAKAIAVVG